MRSLVLPMTRSVRLYRLAYLNRLEMSVTGRLLHRHAPPSVGHPGLELMRHRGGITTLFAMLNETEICQFVLKLERGNLARLRSGPDRNTGLPETRKWITSRPRDVSGVPRPDEHRKNEGLSFGRHLDLWFNGVREMLEPRFLHLLDPVSIALV